MSQLKSNLFSLDRNSLENFGQNALKDLGNQTLGQFKEQFTQSALGSVSNALNLNLSPSQMMNIGQMIANPAQSVQAIREQGIDFFKDQASALLAQRTKGLVANFTAATDVGVGLDQGFITESLRSDQAVLNTPVEMQDDFIKKDEYSSRFLTYTVTTRKNTGVPAPSVTKFSPAVSAQTTAQPKPRSELGKDVVRMDLEESRHLTTKVTVRKTQSEEQDIYHARDK